MALKPILGISCVTIFAALLLVSPAQAGVKTFSGNVKGGGKVTFEVKFKRDKPKVAGFIEVSQLPVGCTEGPTMVGFSHSDLDIQVRKRKFHYSFQGFKASFSGKLKKNGRKASGELDYGPSDPGSTNCDTNGPRRWTASR